MNKTAALVGGIVAIVVVVAAVMIMMPKKEEKGGESPPAAKVTVNSKQYGWSELDDLEAKTVSGLSGISLSAIVNHSGLADPASRQYELVASDGYYKNVTWADMMEGILVKTTEGKNVSFKSAFSSLPKRYNVRNIVEIQGIDTPTLTVNGREYTWEQPFDTMFELVNMSGRLGVRLSDIVNHTGLADPAGHDFTLKAGDGYNKTVNWSSMLSGVLVSEGHETAFESLPKGYQVKDLVEILAVPA